jgi:ferredoxin-NADP reductase
MTARCLRSLPANWNPTTRFNCAGRSEGISFGPLWNGGVLCCWSAAGVGLCRSMCMLRHRRLSGSAVPAALLYSVRTREDLVYHEELTDLARNDPRFTLRTTLTRDSAPGWSGRVGRIDLAAVQALLEGLGGVADSFVCGSAGFVEAASTLLLQAGQPGDAIRTERFGPTGT